MIWDYKHNMWYRFFFHFQVKLIHRKIIIKSPTLFLYEVEHILANSTRGFGARLNHDTRCDWFSQLLVDFFCEINKRWNLLRVCLGVVWTLKLNTQVWQCFQEKVKTGHNIFSIFLFLFNKTFSSSVKTLIRYLYLI